jgi:hypothetical protein
MVASDGVSILSAAGRRVDGGGDLSLPLLTRFRRKQAFAGMNASWVDHFFQRDFILDQQV